MKIKLIVGLLLVLALLFPTIALAGTGADIPEVEYIDGEYDHLPTWWVVESWNTSTDCGYWVSPDRANPEWRVKACCLEPDNAHLPEPGDSYYRDGGKLFGYNHTAQDAKIHTVVLEPPPEPKEYRLYIPMAFSGHKFYACDCQYHTCIISVDHNIWRTLYLLEYPQMGTVNGTLNLDATKNQKLNIRCYFKRGSVHSDPGYDKTILIIDCKGKDAYTVYCPNGICPSISCNGLNGTAPCIATAATYTCDLICRGKFNLTDSQ